MFIHLNLSHFERKTVSLCVNNEDGEQFVYWHNLIIVYGIHFSKVMIA